MEFFWATLPLLVLIAMMGHSRGLPGFVALPSAAVLSFFLSLFAFGNSTTLTVSAVLSGLLSALTPLSIVFGALFLFSALRISGAMDVITHWVRGLGEHPVAQLMLVGWAFPFLIEGISGFGTPAALAAPLLVGLGFPPLRVCFMVLVSNTVPVAFGAVGTPIWFGFEAVNLSAEESTALSRSIGLVQFVCGTVIPFMALLQVLPWKTVFENWRFVLFSAWSCVFPMWIFSGFGAEFPSLAGGLMGLFLTAVAVKRKFGLTTLPSHQAEVSADPERRTQGGASLRRLLFASSPLWGSILFLFFTRVPELGLKGFLLSRSPLWGVSIPWLGEFEVSRSLVLSLKILAGGHAPLSQWEHALLYVPSIFPFVVVVCVFCFFWSAKPGQLILQSAQQALRQLARPCLALFGALVVVKLLLLEGGNTSPVQAIGDTLASSLGEAWPWFAFYLGALGSFFSGSATVSNLTFGPIQAALGDQLQLKIPLLVLQAVGAAAGNMVCLHNIVAVFAILGLRERESMVLKRASLILLCYGALATTTVWFFFL